MTLPPFPASSGLQNLIEKAKEDLVQRSSIPITQINLVEAREVVWPDASLGCPRPEMAYAQVLTPGYLILLKAGDTTFEFHASKRGAQVTYCENPTASPPFTPDII